MYTRNRDFRVSMAMRDLLIEHLDGSAPIIRSHPNRGKTMATLLCRSWIVYGHGNNPTHTFITQAGREALTTALADWAEAIARANRWRETAESWRSYPPAA